MQSADLRQLLRIAQLAAPLGDTRWVTFNPSPQGLTVHYDGMHSGGVTAAKGVSIKGLSGLLTVNAKLLGDGLDLLGADEVTITCSRGSLVLSAAGQRLTVRGSAASGVTFPKRLAKTAPAIVANTQELLDTVRYLCLVAGGPQGAPVLTGIHISVGPDGRLRLEAADGIAATITGLEAEVTGAPDILVPAADLEAALGAVSDNETVTLRSSESVVEILVPGTYIRLSLLADRAKYPDLDRLPVDGYTLTFTLPAARVTAAAQAAALIHHQRAIDLVCTDGKLKMVTSSDEQGSYELAVGRVKTPDFSLTLDAEYLRLATNLGTDIEVSAGHPSAHLVMLTGNGRAYWLAEMAVSGRRASAAA